VFIEKNQRSMRGKTLHEGDQGEFDVHPRQDVFGPLRQKEKKRVQEEDRSVPIRNSQGRVEGKGVGELNWKRGGGGEQKRGRKKERQK